MIDITALQQDLETRLANLDGTESPETILLLTAAVNNLAQGRSISVDKYSDLPDLTVTPLPSGSIFYVKKQNILMMSVGTEWRGLDGRTPDANANVSFQYAASWGQNIYGALGTGDTTSRITPVQVAGNFNTWSDLSAGFEYSLGIANGVAYAWGGSTSIYNYGQLGDGTTSSRISPVAVAGGITNWSQVSAGLQFDGNHSLGLTSNGVAYGWGYNAYGQVGDNTTVNKSSPVTVVGGVNWVDISAGYIHSLGIANTGIAYAWGLNSDGRLGDNTTGSKNSPVTVVGGIANWKQVSAGGTHSLGVTSNGAAYSWGAGSQGQLGEDRALSRLTPNLVIGNITGWSQVKAGTLHSVGLTNTGIAYTWGLNNYGQLGDGTVTSRPNPAPVAGNLVWSAVHAGGSYNLGIANGIAYAWGYNNFGQLGDGTTTSRRSPVSVIGGITNWSSVTGSDTDTVAHSLGIANGIAYAWGYNAYGQVGDNTATNRSSPVTVVGGITNWSQLAPGLAFTLGLTANGVAYGWGLDNYNQLGNGSWALSRFSPYSVAGSITNWNQIDSGGFHTLAVANGVAYAWGYNLYGRLGDNTASSRASPVTVVGGITDWIQVSAGNDHSLGVTNTGIAYAWGYNNVGQLGDASISSRSSPVTIAGNITNWNQLSAGGLHSLGLTSTGLAYGWGLDNFGQLGSDSWTLSKSSPVSAETGITNWNQIDTGHYHTLAIANGVAYGWGYNNYGQLGDNTATNRSSPVTVVGGITDWSQLSAGADHSLGLTSTGVAYAWGHNQYGGLGDGTTSSRSSPVTVVGGITGWSQLSSARGRHSLGIANGVAYAWGYNIYGQLGDNTATNRSSPVTVVGGITDWSQLSAGDGHSLGVTSSGIAYSWGQGNYAQLGDGGFASRSSPGTVVGGITNWSQVSAGLNFSLGVTSTGVAYAWGYNNVGQLGDNTLSTRSSPVTVVGGITNWSKLSATYLHSLGLTTSGTAYAWGYNTSGQLGDNTTSSRLSPVTVIGGITNWSQVSTGLNFSLGVTSTGIVYTWGSNQNVQLGRNNVSYTTIPRLVYGGITDWSQLSAGNNHSIGVTSSGTAYAWGNNQYGMLGDNTTVNKSSPVTVVGGITNWSQASAGGNHSLGVTSSGIAYGWGRGDSGQLGDNTSTNKPSPVTVVGGITNWSQISAGGYHSFGLTANGIAYAWGYQGTGMLGDGTYTLRSSPVTVAGGTTWIQLSAGSVGSISEGHSSGITSTGVAYGWGLNNYGQLGSDNLSYKVSPTLVGGNITDWIQLAAGNTHSLGIISTGIAYAWGYNNYGQLGDGTVTSRSSPVTVVGGITNWSQISAGGFSIGLAANGQVYAWGLNNVGQLGDNTTSSRLSPVSIGAGIVFTDISAGNNHSAGLTSTNLAYAWGDNQYGQVGSYNTSSRSSPAPVVGGITDWSQLSAASYSLGVTSSGIAYAWGSNGQGNLGDNTTSNRSSPVPIVGGITNWSQISAGGSHSLGTTSSGQVYSWGSNSSGKLGDNTTSNRSSPVSINTSVVIDSLLYTASAGAISAGYQHSLAIPVLKQDL